VDKASLYIQNMVVE